MEITRRHFFQLIGIAGASVAKTQKKVFASESGSAPDPFGCLVDLTRCTGCRKCEEACSTANELQPREEPFDVSSIVFETKRRPDEKAYTVVNRYVPGPIDRDGRLIPVFVKVQCMHCQDPACVSACIVGALTKETNGTVRYDVTKCIGCRYCMVACPFEMPAYEYHDPLTPEIRKCTFCHDTISKEGGLPACAEVCPVEAITFGSRETLLAVAKKRLSGNPGNYVKHIYGEKEVGGTSWLYISPVPFKKLGFPDLPSTPLPKLSESIQHALFTFLWSPILLFGILSGIMFASGRKNEKERPVKKSAENNHEAKSGTSK